MSKIIGSDRVKRGMAEMQKGGVIMDVVNAEQARIAEEAGAVAVMALERVPSDIRAAGGVATPQDAALMMELGADGVFVGSGIFKSEDPEKFAKAIVQATTHYQDYELIGRLASELGTAMKGLDINQLSLEERMQERGW